MQLVISPPRASTAAAAAAEPDAAGADADARVRLQRGVFCVLLLSMCAAV
jgi:hypothetical protein